MPFVKGSSGNPLGRPPGAVNQITKTVKQTVWEVFTILQDDPKHSLLAFARENHKAFYDIASKLMPTEIKADVSTPEGFHIILQRDPGCDPLGTNPEDFQEGNPSI